MNTTTRRIVFYVAGISLIVAAYFMISMKIERDQDKKQQNMNQAIEKMKQYRGN